MTNEIMAPTAKSVISDRLTWSDIFDQHLVLMFVRVDCSDSRQRMLTAQETINTQVSDSITASNAPSPLR